jgi:hypothetical protein
LASLAPAKGPALELASGTGQHIVGFARRMPGLAWRPSEVDPIRAASITAYVKDAALDNLHPPLAVDATAPGWGARHSEQALIVVVNLLHLISTGEAEVLISEAAAALASNGRVAIYGPFLRDGATTSEGDARFDASLRKQDPEIGYKDVLAVSNVMLEAGLSPPRVLEMPANNLMLVAER